MPIIFNLKKSNLVQILQILPDPTYHVENLRPTFILVVMLN